MRFVIVSNVNDIENLKLSDPKKRPDGTFASSVYVKERRQFPCVVFNQCKVRKYTTDSSGNITMSLTGLSSNECAPLRGILDEILSFISEKRTDWFPPTHAPKNISVLQRCFNDPLEENTKTLLISRASTWTTSSSNNVKYSAGKKHTVRLTPHQVRFDNTQINVEWKIIDMKPSEVSSASPRPILFSRVKSVAMDPSTHDMFLPDAEESDEILRRGLSKLEKLIATITEMQTKACTLTKRVKEAEKTGGIAHFDSTWDFIMEVDDFSQVELPNYVHQLCTTNQS